MTDKVILDNVSVVLHQPRYPENIGAAARAICNMGMSRLLVVDPREYDLEKIRKMATPAASDIVAKIEVYEKLKEALSPFQYIIGCTARIGKQRQAIDTPSNIAGQLVSISKNNHIAIVFGPEDRGLSNTDIRYCHVLVNIPTAEFSSLNLAQAVMIICYEIFSASSEETIRHAFRLATRYELEGMYEQLKEILVRISFINPENPDYGMNNFRRFFERMRLRAKEVSIIRGICRQINWYGKKCYKEGRES